MSDLHSESNVPLNCEQVDLLLSADIEEDPDLTSEERSAIAVHLERCRACQQLLVQIGAVRRAQVLNDDLVRANRLHLIVDPVGAPLGIAFDAIQRIGMRKHSDLRWTLRGQAKKRIAGIRFIGAKRTATRCCTRVVPVPYDHPTARDGIFTKFHE